MTTYFHNTWRTRVRVQCAAAGCGAWADAVAHVPKSDLFGSHFPMLDDVEVEADGWRIVQKDGCHFWICGGHANG